MSIQYEKLERCYEYYRNIADFHPRVGLVLGSGLGGYAKNMHVEKEIPYREIPDFLNEPLISRFPLYRGMTEDSYWDGSGKYRSLS